MQTSYQQTAAAFTAPEADASLSLCSAVENCGAQGCTTNSAGNPAPAGSTVVLAANSGSIWSAVGVSQASPGDTVDGSISLYPQVFATGQV